MKYYNGIDDIHLDENGKLINIEWDSKESEDDLIERASELDMSEFSKDDAMEPLNIQFPLKVLENVDLIGPPVLRKRKQKSLRLNRRVRREEIARDKSAVVSKPKH